MGQKRQVTYKFDMSDNSKKDVVFEVEDGDGAYEAWRKQPGNGGKTKEQYFASIKGKRGVDVTGLTTNVTEL